MIKSIFNNVKDEFLSRLITVNHKKYIIEYFSTNWSREFKEIDNSFVNGYHGIYNLGINLSPLEKDIKPIEKRISEINKIELLKSGYHFGKGIIDYFISKGFVSEQIYTNEIVYKNTNIDGVYTGKVGSKLSNVLSQNNRAKYFDEKKYFGENDDSFSHGKLGSLYTLLNEIKYGNNNNENKKIALKHLKILIENTSNENNYSLCNGNLTKYVVFEYARNILSNKDILIPNYKNIIIDRVYTDIMRSQNNFPLNLCCGISGLSEIFCTLWEYTGDLDYLEVSKELLRSKITEVNLKECLSSGVLYGVFGIVYQILRVFPELNIKKTIPSLIFINN